MMGLIPAQSTVSGYIEAGVAGFILKDADSDRFIKTILKKMIKLKSGFHRGFISNFIN